MNKNLKSIVAAAAIFFAVAACTSKTENSAEATDNAASTETTVPAADTTQADTTSQVSADTTAAKQ